MCSDCEACGLQKHGLPRSVCIRGWPAGAVGVGSRLYSQWCWLGR